MSEEEPGCCDYDDHQCWTAIGNCFVQSIFPLVIILAVASVILTGLSYLSIRMALISAIVSTFSILLPVSNFIIFFFITHTIWNDNGDVIYLDILFHGVISILANVLELLLRLCIIGTAWAYRSNPKSELHTAGVVLSTIASTISLMMLFGSYVYHYQDYKKIVASKFKYTRI